MFLPIPHARALLLCAALSACSAATPPPAKTPKPALAATTTNPRQALFDALRTVKRPPAVLDALPAASRARLEQIIQSLSAEERVQLSQSDDPSALTHPLLHWAAGGTALAVYASSVQSSALSDDWVGLAAMEQPPAAAAAAAELVQVGNELVRRAAGHLLRERAADFSANREPSVLVLREVVAAAALLDQDEVEALATKEWAAQDQSAEAQLTLFQLHVRKLDLNAAESLLTQLKSNPALANELQHATRQLEILRQLVATPRSAENTISLARSFQELELPEQALELVQTADASGLAATTELLRAQLGGSVCPQVLRRNAALCRAAFVTKTQELAVQTTLERAWQQEQGRDAIAVEHFLGLSLVTPLMYQQDQNGTALTPQTFTQMLQGLEQRAQEAKVLSPRFEALALMAEALRSAVESSLTPSGPGRPVIAPAQRENLRNKAKQLNGSADAWSKAASLAVLAMSLQDDPVGAELSSLRDGVAREQRPTLAAMELWTALADKDAQRFAELSDRLPTIIEDTASSGEQRSRWLLTFAEAEVLLRPSEKASATLLALCERLGQNGVPLDLRLRAALNRAGLLARQNQQAEAKQFLATVVEQVPRDAVDSAEAQEFLVAITGYHWALRGLEPSERESAAQELTQLLVQLREGSAASPSVLMWLGLWRGELEALKVEQQCGKTAACRAKAKAARGISDSALRAAVGDRTGRLLKNGVLPMGGAQIDLRYSASIGLLPQVAVDVSFPVVQVPPL